MLWRLRWSFFTAVRTTGTRIILSRVKAVIVRLRDVITIFITNIIFIESSCITALRNVSFIINILYIILFCVIIIIFVVGSITSIIRSKRTSLTSLFICCLDIKSLYRWILTWFIVDFCEWCKLHVISWVALDSLRSLRERLCS